MNQVYFLEEQKKQAEADREAVIEELEERLEEI
jgi:hypothetical protein